MQRVMYDEILQDDTAETRRRERDAFDHVIAKLSMVSESAKKGQDHENAMQATESLWMVLLEDLVKPENGLPKDLKGRLISIGLWMMKEIAAQRVGVGVDLKALIDVNQIIRDGLE